MLLRRCLFVLVLNTSIAPIAEARGPANDSRFYRPNENYEILSYDQYRKLSSVSQIAYIKDFQAFFSQLSEQGLSGEEDPDQVSAMTHLLNIVFSSTSEVATAADAPADPCTTYFYQPGGSLGASTVCSYTLKTGSNVHYNEDCSHPDAIAKRAAACPTNAQDYLTKTQRDILSSGKPATAKQQSNLALISKGVQQSNDPYIKESTLSERTEQAKRVAADKREEQGRQEAQALATPEGKAKLAQQDETRRQKTQEEKVDQDLAKEGTSDADLKKFGGDLRCIAAGFVVTNAETTQNTKSGKKKSCGFRSQWTSKDGKKIISCTTVARSDAGKAKEVIQAPAKSGPVLCNPVVFGLTADSKPICVQPSKSATKACRAASKKDEAKSLEAARKLLNENPDEYAKLRRTADKLCQGTNNTEIKNYITSKLSRIEKAADDLAKTCIAFGDKFGAHARGLDSSGGSETSAGRQ